MVYALTAIDYQVQQNKPVIYLFARDACLNRKVFKIDSVIPYYYKRDDDRGTVPTIDGHQSTIIKCQLPGDVGRDREKYAHTYESDVLFPLRFLVDRGIRYGFDVEEGKVVPADFKGLAVRPLFLDVEVEVTDTNVFPDARVAKWMILAVHIWIPIDGNIAQWRFEIHNEEEEREFLEFFITLVEEFDPDIFTAYNVFFDLCTILNRMKHHHIDASRLSQLGRVRIDERFDEIHIAGRNVFDYYAGYKKYKHKTLPSFKLEEVALDECGIPKSDYPMDKMNRDHVPEIADYNMLDVFRMQALDQKLTVVEFYDNIRQVVGCTYNEVMEASKYVDIFLLRYAKGKFVLPRKPKGAQRVDYVGGLVKSPVKGVHRNVIYLDFTKHYPTILISYNISPETLRTAEPEEPHYTLPIGLKFKDEDGKPYVEWREVYYLKDPPGFLPEIAKDLIGLREAVQTAAYEQPRGTPEYEILWHRQDALKVVLDAMYGVFAYPRFRLFQPYISATMTGQGRKIIERSIEFVEDQGLVSIYGDTDSVCFVAGENKDPIKEGIEVRDKLNAFWEIEKDKFGLYGAPSAKLEYVFESLMLAKKKRYSGKIIYENGAPQDKLLIVGFEPRRSDSAVVSRNLQKKLFEMIHSFAGNDAIIDYIKSFAAEARKLPLKDIGLPCPLKTPIKAMKNVARVKSIVYSNKYMQQKIETGARPLEFYIKGTQLKGAERKAFGFKDKPTLPWTLPAKFSLWTWSPKAESFGYREYAADRVAFSGKVPEEWRQYVDMDRMIEKAIYNKVETILSALGVSEEERIELYGSRRPIKKEKVD